jgi:murein tripeptide amidase MpaA
VTYAYFTPYSYDRHRDLIESSKARTLCQHRVIGQTSDGNPIDWLVVGQEGQGKRKVWVTARQHPGETMAQWYLF